MRSVRTWFADLQRCPGLPLVLVLPALLLAPVAGGCVALPDQENMQIWTDTYIGEVSANHTVGQTFLSSQNGLCGIDVHADLASSSRDANTRVALTLSLDDGEEVAKAILPSSVDHIRGILSYRFDPFEDSANRSFKSEFFSSEDDIAAIPLWGSDGDRYPNGVGLRDGELQSSDLAFVAYYRASFKELASSILGRLSNTRQVLGAVLLLIIMPGCFWAELLSCSRHTQMWNRLTHCITLGLLVPVISASFIQMLGLRLTAALTKGYVAVAALGCLVQWSWRSLRARKQTTIRAARLEGNERLFDVAVWVLLVLVVTRSFAQIENVEVPLWVDSILHAERISYIASNGRLPQEFYHYGFHIITALLHQISGVSVPATILVWGQLLNAFAYLAILSLTYSLFRNLPAALLAAAFTAFGSAMPSYFVTWGRYPLFMGIALLSGSLIYLVDFAKTDEYMGNKALTVGLSIVGVTLCHTRLLAFYVCFAIITGLVFAASGRRPRQAIRPTARLILVITLGSLSILALWFGWFKWQGSIANALRVWQYHISFQDTVYALRLSLSGPGGVAAALAIIGLGVGLLRRNLAAMIVVGWVVLLAGLACFPVSMSGWGVLDTPTFALTLFLPISLGITCLLSTSRSFLLNRLSTRAAKRGTALFCVIGFVACLLTMTDSIALLNPTTFLFRPPDERAMAWICQNIPPGATFVVNTMRWGRGYASSDGGAWIPYYCDARVDPETSTRIGRLMEGTERSNLSSFVQESFRQHLPLLFIPGNRAKDTIYRVLQKKEVTHVYLGRRGGLLHAEYFLQWPENFQPIYNRDGTWVFAVQ